MALVCAVDYAKAWSWLYKAAALGNATAENQLGWMYQYGQGVKADDAIAVTLYRLSADQGNTSGDDNLRDLSASTCTKVVSKLCDSGNACLNYAAIEMVQRARANSGPPRPNYRTGDRRSAGRH